jgi:hypothetical protein
MKRILLFLLFAGSLHAQSWTGELRLKVLDPAGLGVRSAIQLISEGNQFRQTFVTNDSGFAVARRLPFGGYTVHVQQPGFAPFSESVEVRSVLPADFVVHLSVASVNTSVVVNDTETLVDPHVTGSTDRIGRDAIDTRTTSLPGRSLQDLVNSQPGWLYEGNAVLHPRGSEYQTQFVVDGIPLTDNRSPSFGPEIEADGVQSMNIYTAGIPAEYGRKMGGVVEVNTLQDAQTGLHGQVVLSGGSFDTAGAFSNVQYAWGKNVFGVSGDGNATGRYLNPVVPQNYTNSGTTGDFSVQYERDFTARDRLSVSVRHELSRYEIPNEQVQQNPHQDSLDSLLPPGSQLQTGDNFETMGILSYQHIFSPDVVADFRGMVRDNSSDLNSNPYSTPIIAFQSNWFREGYFKASVAVHRGRHELKFGVESDNLFLHEDFRDQITDFSQYDPGTPSSFSFSGSRPDLEQSAFVQDLIRLGKWTISAGLRWDHYQLLANQQAVSPRFSVGRYFPSADLVLHASYDRVFQTPSFENILLSSSKGVISLNQNVLRLPVAPSHGNYYEIGLTKGVADRFKLDANVFRREFNNFVDDDQLLNTGVSFPISFERGILYGAEGKIDLPTWHGFSGFVSYSYIVGSAWFPVTGGLFLGQDATSAQTQLTGHFPDSQDQRNTLRYRLRYELTSRLWLGTGLEYGSGLPFDFAGTQAEALAEYGQQVVDRINFARGRVRPSLSVDAMLGTDIYKSERVKLQLEGDLQNLNNRPNVMDFGGLFSGNAIAPPRSYALRLQAAF